MVSAFSLQCNDQTMNYNDAIKPLAKPSRGCLLNMLINWSLNGESEATEGFMIRLSDGDR